jgi:PucR C-terminal helix-turn-helix domain
MTSSVHNEPWRALPPAVADLIEPELDAATAEILTAIAADVPEYARPLEGNFGRGVRRGVSEALRQFVALVRDPEAGRGVGREVYLELGRGELRQGRTLDSLQAAYRVGARVAWRRLSAAGREADLDSESLSLLAEAIFAYIDELSADSVEGYADAQAEREDERRRGRRELAALLIRSPPVDPAGIRTAAQRAGWPFPDRAAALACPEDALPEIARRLPPDALATALGDSGCVLLPDPDGPGRMKLLKRAAGSSLLILGPPGAITDLPSSWQLSRSALAASRAGAIPAAGLLRVDDHLTDLLLYQGGALVDRMAARRLAPFDALTPKAQARMRETALAYVQNGGNAVQMAQALHLHPQTIRYRISQLRDLLGDGLDDPGSRLELELALRSISGGACEAGS